MKNWTITRRLAPWIHKGQIAKLEIKLFDPNLHDFHLLTIHVYLSTALLQFKGPLLEKFIKVIFPVLKEKVIALRQSSKTKYPQEDHSTGSMNIAGDTEPDKPLNQKTLQLIDESIKIGPPEHSVESVQETNIIKKDKSIAIQLTANDSKEIYENQIPASVKPNKIEFSVVELCQTLCKFDVSGILNKLLTSQSLFWNKLGHLENEIKELKVIKKDGVDPAPNH